MASHDQRVDGWTVVLRRQLVRVVEGRAEGGFADVFELMAYTALILGAYLAISALVRLS
jgi:hypothetical protein